MYFSSHRAKCPMWILYSTAFLRLCHKRSTSVGTNFLMIQFVTLGNFSSFMQKEIFEQPESVVNTMRGRVNFDDYTGNELKMIILEPPVGVGTGRAWKLLVLYSLTESCGCRPPTVPSYLSPPPPMWIQWREVCLELSDARGIEQEVDQWLPGAGRVFQFEKMRKFWGWMIAMVVQQCERA